MTEGTPTSLTDLPSILERVSAHFDALAAYASELEVTVSQSRPGMDTDTANVIKSVQRLDLLCQSLRDTARAAKLLAQLDPASLLSEKIIEDIAKQLLLESTRAVLCPQTCKAKGQTGNVDLF